MSSELINTLYFIEVWKTTQGGWCLAISRWDAATLTNKKFCEEVNIPTMDVPVRCGRHILEGIFNVLKEGMFLFLVLAVKKREMG